MKSGLALITAMVFAFQPCILLADVTTIRGPDTRLYLVDGSVIQGQLIEKTKDLVIIRVDHEIFSFDLGEITNIVTIDSLGGAVRTIEVTEFPYISFLGGAAAFSLLSWLQFDRASDRDKDAELNRQHGQQERARKLADQADRARLYGWGAAVLATGSLGIALIPRKATRRVLPALAVAPDAAAWQLTWVYRF